MRPTLLIMALLLPAAACSATGRPEPAPVAESRTSAPTSTSTAIPSVTPTADQRRSWRVRRTSRADLDGDGIGEEIGYGGKYGPIRITALLSGTGERTTLQAGLDAISWWPEGYANLDHVGGSEIVLARESAQQRPVVISLYDGKLAEARTRDRQPLVNGPTAGPERGTAYANEWYVRDGSLVSYRSIHAFPLSSHLFDVPDRYAVRRWSWTLYGDHLRATDEGYWCKDASSQYPAPCGSDLPDLFPAVTSTRPASVFPGELPPSECGPAEVSTVRIPGGTGGTEGWLVLGPGCAESSANEVYVAVDGGWAAARHPERPAFGSGIRELARGHMAYTTWVTADGSLFTRRGPMGSARARVWSWTLDGAVLTPTDLGMVCFDPVDRPRRYGSC